METTQTDQFLETFEEAPEDRIANLPYPKCCEEDPEGEYHSHPDDGTEQLTLFPEKVEEKDPTIFTVSAIAFDFDFGEPRILLVKNKKPPRRSKEGKPGGFGLPTGQLESKEDMFEALKRETRDESGCSVRKIIGKLFVVNKRLKIDKETVPNEIHVFLVEATDVLGKVREVDEIDGSIEPWIPLRQVFEMPVAQDKNGGSRNSNGIYYQHLSRIYRAIDSMVYNPEEELIDGEAIKKWLKPNRKALVSAMADLKQDGLLEEFLPKDDLEEVPV